MKNSKKQPVGQKKEKRGISTPARKSKEEIVKLNQELSILNAISQAVNQSIDQDEMLNKSVDKMMEMIDVHEAGISLLDEKHEAMALVVHRGYSAKLMEMMRVRPVDKSLLIQKALSEGPIFIEDYPSYSEGWLFPVEDGLKALAVIPLKSRDRVYGLLNVARYRVSKFTLFERSLLTSIGQILTGGLERTHLYTEHIKRLEELNTLYAINHEIASKLELKGILKKILESAVDLLGAASGGIVLWDSRKQHYAFAMVHHLPKSFIGTQVSSPPIGVAGETILRKSPCLFQDYEHHPKRLKELDAYHVQEVLGIPLIVREMIIGAMMVGTSDPNIHFKQKEIDRLYHFASQAAVAIGNAKLYEDSLAKIKHLTALYDIGKTLSSTLDLDELFKKALDLLNNHFGFAYGAILLLDPEKEELFVKCLIGKNIKEYNQQTRFRVGADGMVGWVAKTGEPYYAPDVSKDPHYLSGAHSIRSEADFPLKVRDQVFGVLNIESDELNGFDEEDLKVLSSFASQMSVSIENAQLFSDLKQALQELKQTQDQMVQTEKLRAMGEMASGVAHDFNNILAVILGNIQLLLHQMDHLGLKEIREGLKNIERSSKDGAETIRRLQGFTGARRDKEFSTVSFNEIITEIINVTQPRWKTQTQKTGVQIDVTTQLEEVPWVMGNPSELREVMTNIIFNAVDAMPEGGQLKIVTQQQSEGWVEIRVSDTGAGMTDEIKMKVFDPFFTTKGVKNSGLGMSVSYGIIKRHGGEILIESELGKGSTFIIHLPTGDGGEEAVSKSGLTMSDAPQARILVIDDEDSVQSILSQILQSRGHEVVLASNGEEGIKRFRLEPFDLVFTDLGMPKMSGWEVGKTIKGINAKIPIAMITGWGMELDKTKLGESGIDLVVSKPFDYDQVLQLVAEAMELKERM